MYKCPHCLRETEVKCTRSECLEAQQLEEAEALGRHGTCRRCRLPKVVSRLHDPACTWHSRHR